MRKIQAAAKNFTQKRGAKMIFIGCHLSVAEGYAAMGQTMSRFGGNTFAWFTRNPLGGKTKPADPDDIAALLHHAREKNFGPLVAHGSYTMNLCSVKPETRANGLDMLKQDLAKMEMLPGNLYNLHPGSHTGQGTKAGIAQIAAALNQVLRLDMHTTVLLETMAGKGSEIGGVEVKVDTSGFSNDLTSFQGKNDVLTLLIHLGYPAYDADKKTVRIPNEEIRLEYQRSIHEVTHAATLKCLEESEKLFMDTILRNEEAVAKQIEKVHMEETAAIHYNKENSLRSVIKLAYYSYREH